MSLRFLPVLRAHQLAWTALRVRAARRVADAWATAGRADSALLALDADVLLGAVATQHEAARSPASILDVTAPTCVCGDCGCDC